MTARIRAMAAADAEAVAELATQLGYPTDPHAMAERISHVGSIGDRVALLVAVDGADQPLGWTHVEQRDTSSPSRRLS